MLIPHSITRLHLHRFRNHHALQLEVNAEPVVITGHNGAGKTNILEAISLLSPGRGFRGAALKEMDYQKSEAWVVSAEVTRGDETMQIGTGRDAQSRQERRIVRINGESIRSQRELAKHVAVQWVTPAMDHVFTQGGTPRRKLLDRITYHFSPEHAEHVASFERAMRERNRLLADRSRADIYWLSVLEQQMAENAVAITHARREALERLRGVREDVEGFPHALVALHGAIESWMDEGLSALEIESRYAERLMTLRVVDAARGRATEGPQRSRFDVIHSLNGREAAECSTGEQKALLLSLILNAAQARISWCGSPPILLLDEVIAHLDVDKKNSLFALIRATGVQTWLTGTNPADFEGLGSNANHLKIAGGTVCV
jgi:DNA replication and repair protein RecF